MIDQEAECWFENCAIQKAEREYARENFFQAHRHRRKVSSRKSTEKKGSNRTLHRDVSEETLETSHGGRRDS